MILQALADYYDRMRAADPDALPEPGFERKEIPFIIVLSKEGRFLNLEDTREGEGKKKRGRVFTVPQGEKRPGTKGWQKPFLLWDHCGFVLGQAVGGKSAEQASLQHDAFKERVRRTFSGTTADEGVRAVMAFLDAGDFSPVVAHPLWADVTGTAGANLSFRLADDLCLVPEREAVVSAVRRSAVTAGGPTAQCLITGERAPIAVLHPAIKGVRGGQAVGGNIVSFNLDAFRSHGREQGANAPVSARAAFAYTTALNRLLSRDSGAKVSVGDTTVVFWAATANPIEDLAAALFGDEQGVLDDPERGVEKLRAVFSAPWQGHPPLREDATRFFVLGLAPNAGRIAIRFWRPTTVAEFAAAVLRHFDDVAVVRPPWAAPHPSIRSLLRSTAVLSKDDNIPPKLAGDVLDAIVTGGAYPRTLLPAAIRRARAERDLTPDRAAAIRGCLERAGRRNHEGQGGVTVSLDPSNHNAGYLLGRLFAVLERAQSTANPGIESGIRERYYGSASATPVAAFPTLMKLKNHHLAKIENRGAVVNLERLIGSVMEGIADFPAVLSTSDQGRFALGYYHQRQAFFTKSDSNEEHSDA